MTDTQRTQAAILALIPALVGGEVTCQELRDAIYSALFRDGSSLADKLGFNTALGAEPTNVAGTLYWWDDSLNLALGNGIVLQLGEEVFTTSCRNNTDAAMTIGQAVYISGATGSHTTLALASCLDDTSQELIGLTTTAIAKNANGRAAISGIINGIDTHLWTEGTLLYLGATPGSLTSTKPSGASRVVEIGKVVTQGTTDGSICIMVHPRRPITMLFGLTERAVSAPSATYKALDIEVMSDTSRIFFDKTYFPGTCEVLMLVKSTSGNPVSFQLWDETAGAAVVHDAITTSSTSFVLKYTGLLTLGTGLREYSIRAKYDAAADSPKLGYAVMSVR